MSAAQIGRVVMMAIAVEVLAVLGLVAVVAAFGPREAAAARLYAESTGAWFGPIASAALCCGAGWWVARAARPRALFAGCAVGLAVAAIDISILMVSGTPMKTLFLLSNAGKIVAAGLGALLAGRNVNNAV